MYLEDWDCKLTKIEKNINKLVFYYIGLHTPKRDAYSSQT